MHRPDTRGSLLQEDRLVPPPDSHKVSALRQSPGTRGDLLQEDRSVPLVSYQKLSAPRQKNCLPDNYVPSGCDIICGRGKRLHCHPGNKRFREIVAANVQRYMKADSKLDKTLVVLSLVEKIREGPPVCRFVKLDEKTKKWWEIGDQSAHEKVGHALRDAITAKKKGNSLKKTEKRKNSLKEKIPSKQKAVPPLEKQRSRDDHFEKFVADAFLEPIRDDSFSDLDFGGDLLDIPEGLEAAFQPIRFRDEEPLQKIDTGAAICSKQPSSSFPLKYSQLLFGEKKVLDS